MLDLGLLNCGGQELGQRVDGGASTSTSLAEGTCWDPPFTGGAASSRGSAEIAWSPSACGERAWDAPMLGATRALAGAGAAGAGIKDLAGCCART